MIDRSGQRLDKYRLIRKLGVGSFGEVYLGEDSYKGGQVAIKVFPPFLPKDFPGFLNEVRTVRLRHPHIIQILDFGIDHGTPFIVMDYAPNGTLRDLYPKGTKVPVNLVVSHLQQIASALQYAHDERLIHRDIKPENILLGQNHELLVSDFGISTIAHSSRSQSVVDGAGTIAYMAPEQIQSRPRCASDQYALAVMAYEWLCGERPFTGSPIEVATQHLIALPRPLRETDPTITPEVEQVIMKALSKDPEERFASVYAFVQALQQAFVHQNKPSILIASPTISSRGATLLPATQEHVATVRQLSATDNSTGTPLAVRPYGSDSIELEPDPHESIRLARSTLGAKGATRRRVAALLVTGGAVITAGWMVVVSNHLPSSTLTSQIGQQLKHTSAANSTARYNQASVMDPGQAQTSPSPAPSGTVIGTASTLATNTSVTFTNPVDKAESVLVHLPNGDFVAYERACTHEAVPVYYDAKSHLLICPAHGSLFDPAQGSNVVQGPARAPLKQVPIHVNGDGTITIV